MSRLYILFILFFLCRAGLGQKIEVQTINAEAMKKFKTSGTTIEKSVQFKDKNGINYLIVTTEEAAKDDYNSRTLWIEHFIEKAPSQLRLMHEIIATEKDCPLDNQLALIKAAFEVSDLDNNGYAEVFFMYKSGCKGELNASELHLVFLENGIKASICGITVSKGQPELNKKQPDVYFRKLPQLMQKHANELWKQFENE